MKLRDHIFDALLFSSKLVDHDNAMLYLIIHKHIC